MSLSIDRDVDWVLIEMLIEVINQHSTENEFGTYDSKHFALQKQ